MKIFYFNVEENQRVGENIQSVLVSFGFELFRWKHTCRQWSVCFNSNIKLVAVFVTFIQHVREMQMK